MIINNRNYYSTSANNVRIDWPEVLGRRGPLLPAHRLANQFIKEGKPITAAEVNKVLAFAGISITQPELDIILSPSKVYSNPDSQKKQITKDNKDKIGVYRWTNLVNGKSYVGSSVNLAWRLSKYYSDGYLKTKLNSGQSAIYRAILKYGHSKFKLEILEYCESPCATFWEQYYLELLRPEYNRFFFLKKKNYIIYYIYNMFTNSRVIFRLQTLGRNKNSS